MSDKLPPRLDQLLTKRSKLVTRLLKSLSHLEREHQFAILTSWLSLEDLEKLVKFQEER